MGLMHPIAGHPHASIRVGELELARDCHVDELGKRLGP